MGPDAGPEIAPARSLQSPAVAAGTHADAVGGVASPDSAAPFLLAFSIPTHHGRCPVLRRALDSVFDQLSDPATDRVQVCVSDNASRDGTAELVAEFQERFPGRLKYHRNAEDQGLIPNLLQSVAMADAEFCWWLGSDDTIEDGAVAKMLGLLDEHPTVAGVTLNRIRIHHVDRNWRQRDSADELPDDPDRLHVYDSADKIFRNVGLSHDFMSTQVLRRASWLDALEVTDRQELARMGDLGQLYVMGKVVQRHPSWIWFPEPLVHHTVGTSVLDEQLQHNYARYQLVIMEGRSRVWGTLFGRGSPLYRTLMHKAYLRSLRVRAVVGLKLWPQHGTRQDLELLTLARYFYWLPQFWLVTFPLLLVPHGVLKALSHVKRRALATKENQQ